MAKLPGDPPKRSSRPLWSARSGVAAALLPAAARQSPSALRWQPYLCLGLVIQPFDAHIQSTPDNHPDWPEYAETSSERALHMLKSQQRRARATASREFVKDSTRAEENRKFKAWRAGFVLSTEHAHKNVVGRNKLPLAKGAPSAVRFDAAALSRWENEGGSARDELPM
jgi:hypothetical protein